MGFRRRAGGGKRDTAERVIVAALVAYGVRIWKLSGTGNADLLCLYRGVYLPLEIKTGKGKATANQADIPWPIVRTADEALALLGLMR